MTWKLVLLSVLTGGKAGIACARWELPRNLWDWGFPTGRGTGHIRHPPEEPGKIKINQINPESVIDLRRASLLSGFE